MSKRYKIIRHFKDSNRLPLQIIAGVTLDEARAHCKNPETSSATCTLPDRVKYTETYGEWFDGYEEDN